jgi:uncharacterized protein
MHRMITLPGVGGSNDSHWQTAWERMDNRFTRFMPTSWERPNLGDWVQALEQAVSDCDRSPVLVAHSLSCLLVAYWASQTTAKIAGAFLVCVPDPTGPQFPSAAASFRRVPTKALPFPSVVIASTNDPYADIDHVRGLAREWQAGLVVAGALGHINVSSGLHDWPQGRGLLDAFCAGLPKCRDYSGPEGPSSRERVAHELQQGRSPAKSDQLHARYARRRKDA